LPPITLFSITVLSPSTQLQRPQVFDAPRFIWRGVLLDVGRHFFSVPFIMKLLDLMALYKMNRFHWHLTEDQVSLWLSGTLLTT
jgi:hexosaminidase